jgi:hypothetical protein
MNAPRFLDGVAYRAGKSDTPPESGDAQWPGVRCGRTAKVVLFVTSAISSPNVINAVLVIEWTTNRSMKNPNSSLRDELVRHEIGK